MCIRDRQKYKAWLLEQPPNVILDNACKFTVREDIVMEMEVLELTDAQDVYKRQVWSASGIFWNSSGVRS